MPAYFDTGFTVRTPAWHGLGEVLDDYPEDWAKAREIAGLEWEPEAVPLFTRRYVETLHADYDAALDASTHLVDGDVIQSPLHDDRYVATGYEFEEDPHTKRIQRDDTGEALAGVSKRFELITHAQMGEVVDAVLGGTNVRFETAGSVREGRQVYCLVRLDEPYVIPGDIDGNGDPVRSYPYLAILNSHDGTGACKVLVTQVRVVCWNTVQAASLDGDRHGVQYSLRHTSGVAERLEDVGRLLSGARSEADGWKERAAWLASQQIGHRERMTFLDEFIPNPPAEIVSERVRANVQRDRDNFMRILTVDPTNSAMQDNALGLFNAAVEFADHARGFRTRDSYMGRQILRADSMKAKAYKMATQVAVGV